MPMVRLDILPSQRPYALVIHAGAGNRATALTAESELAYRDGLQAAYLAGETVLADGGSSLDAVTAAVRSLEDCPLFNAGRGAVLTSSETAELDACVATGDGRNGAIAGSKHARHPVDLARAVMERSAHVMIIDPPAAFVTEQGLEVVDPAWFVTAHRLDQLRELKAKQLDAPRHGTVGAVALDVNGHVAAATSTGGIMNKSVGRVGDSPIVGAGTFARDGAVAISCTGDGEAFIEGVVAHDIYARMVYGHEPLTDAVTATMANEIDTRNATGGLIAVTPSGEMLACHNSAAMFAAFRRDDDVECWL